MANLPTIKRGNTYRFTYTHKHNEEPLSLDGATVAFTVKTQEGDDSANDSTAIIQKIVTQHLDQTEFPGQTVIECTPQETLTQKFDGQFIEEATYFYDIKVKHADGTQYTEIEGKVKVDIAPTNTIL